MDIAAYVDFIAVGVALTIGKGIKSLKIFKKVSNQLIPIILIAVCVGYEVFAKGFNAEALGVGVISAVAAIGFHQSGKTLLINDNPIWPQKKKTRRKKKTVTETQEE